MKFSKEEIQNSMLLYAVTDRMWLKDGEGLTDVCRKVLENGATFLQIREKDLDENTFEQEAEALKELCASYRVPYVVNDSVEIAMDIDADGVHVGQSDIKGRDIRAMIGPDKILGISAGTVEEAQAAEKAGADYIGVGAVFGTSTKKNAIFPVSDPQGQRRQKVKEADYEFTGKKSGLSDRWKKHSGTNLPGSKRR